NQKGRYREFYQCDIDVIGKDQLPLAYDAEIPAVIYTVFHELAFGPFTIHLNNRKLLRGILESLEFAAEQHEHILHEIHRIGKQAVADVQARLVDGPSLLAGEPDPAKQRAAVAALFGLLTEPGRSARDTFAALRALPRPSPAFTEGLDELQRVHDG